MRSENADSGVNAMCALRHRSNDALACMSCAGGRFAKVVAIYILGLDGNSTDWLRSMKFLVKSE